MYRGLKRVADVVSSLVLLTALSPLFFVVAVLVRCDSPGRSVFKQQRIGQYGRPFFIYKFRTMYINAPPNVTAEQRELIASYITPVGRWLRRTSIDELPQLVNVLKGEMSLVGPRPVVAVERELLHLRRNNGALRVRPGITGLAQVHGRYDLTVARRAQYDAYYAKEMSFRLDVRIVMMTWRCLLQGS